VVERGTEHDLILNEGAAIHSIYDPTRLRTDGPWDYFTVAPLFGYHRYEGQRPANVLVIGLAGGTVARELTAAYGAVPIDGVEIDPRIIEVGRRYFAMNEPNLNPIAADGRYFLETSGKQYDLIVVDAYRQPYIPFHLATREFFEACRKHLTPNGVLAINVGRAPRDYRLVDAITGTIGAVFEQVYEVDTRVFSNTLVFAPNQPARPDEVAANFGLDGGAYPGRLAEWVAMVNESTPIRHGQAHGPVWTDDLAPVERLIDAILFDYAAGKR
jgi:SAM-dependent methyltransferase